MRDFAVAARRVEPVAEQVCRQVRRDVSCDFLILVDDRPDQPMNAYHMLSDRGRPLIVFTQSMVADFRNADEAAFVIGHEAAHHIEGHLQSTQQRAMIGGLLIGLAGSAIAPESSPDDIERYMQIGAGIGARVYSKEQEFAADLLGARLAEASGFDAARGVELFARMDGGGGFLSTHPASADRIRHVRGGVQR